MNVSNMKNMVVLKNLPSNLIDEAIVVLKSNTKINKLEKIENFKCSNSGGENKASNGYVLKEAEMLVSEYISKIEDNKKTAKTKKTKNFKRWAYISTAVAFLEFLLLI